jgi:hypothetical protein
VIVAKRKTIVRPARRMSRAISFGVFCRSAPSTSLIIRSRKVEPGSDVISTTIRSERTFVPPVTAERSPPASRITGADSPVIAVVDRRDPFDHGPVARDQLVHLDDDEVALAERGGGDALFAPFGADEPPRDGVRLRPAERIGLGFSAPLGDRLGEVREEDRRPEPEDDLELEGEGPARPDPEEGERREDRAGLDDEHDGVPRHVARVELAEGVGRGPREEGAVEQLDLGGFGHRFGLRTPGPRPSGGARRPGRGRGRERR